jgi:FG-GAP-like repeat
MPGIFRKPVTQGSCMVSRVSVQARKARGKFRALLLGMTLGAQPCLGIPTEQETQRVSFIARRDFSVGGGAPIRVAVSDFNGDGVSDLGVLTLGHSGSANLSILLGKGDGTFRPSQNFAVGSRSASLAVGDFNGDGVADLAVVNNCCANVSVLLGNGDGTFQAAQNFSVGGEPLSVAVGDFDSDGKLDLVVANSGSNSVSVLLGNGDGTFQPAQNFGAGSGPVSVVVGDFNGDGVADLAVANDFSNNVSVLINNTPSQSHPVLHPRRPYAHRPAALVTQNESCLY